MGCNISRQMLQFAAQPCLSGRIRLHQKTRIRSVSNGNVCSEQVPVHSEFEVQFARFVEVCVRNRNTIGWLEDRKRHLPFRHWELSSSCLCPSQSVPEITEGATQGRGGGMNTPEGLNNQHLGRWTALMLLKRRCFFLSRAFVCRCCSQESPPEHNSSFRYWWDVTDQSPKTRFLSERGHHGLFGDLFKGRLGVFCWSLMQENTPADDFWHTGNLLVHSVASIRVMTSCVQKVKGVDEAYRHSNVLGFAFCVVYFGHSPCGCVRKWITSHRIIDDAHSVQFSRDSLSNCWERRHNPKLVMFSWPGGWM